MNPENAEDVIILSKAVTNDIGVDLVIADGVCLNIHSLLTYLAI